MANFKNVADLLSGVSNNIRRKIENQWKKNWVNRSYQFREKSQKLLEITQTPKIALFAVVVVVVVMVSTHWGQVSDRLRLSRILGLGRPWGDKVWGVQVLSQRIAQMKQPSLSPISAICNTLIFSDNLSCSTWVSDVFNFFQAVMHHFSNKFLCFVKRDWLNKGDGWKWTLFIVQPRKFILGRGEAL